MRGEGNDFVDSELEQACNRAAGEDKVEGVTGGDSSLLATNDLASGFGCYICAGELVKVNVPIPRGDPVGNALKKGQELR